MTNQTKNMKILVFTLFFLLSSGICRSAEPIWELCNKDSNYTSNTQISRNLEALTSQLVTKTISTGYTADSLGDKQTKVYGLAQCRGDISSQDCSVCLQDAAEQIKKRCPNQADARILYDFCFLRYSTTDFIGKLDTSGGLIYFNVANVTDPSNFKKELRGLVDKIRSEAVLPQSKGLGKGQTKLSDFVTLYALVQCIRDLSPVDCAQCLATSIRTFEGICNSRQGCRVLYSSCYTRYEIYPFYFPLDSNTKQVSGVTVAVSPP